MGTKTDVYISRKFNCSASELFTWIVEPELIAKWFGPNHLKTGNVETNLCVGGKYRIELLKPNGENFFIEGNYLRIEKYSRLSFSFRYLGISNTPPESIVDITLEEIDINCTKLSFIQSFKTIPSDMENRTNAWENMFARLNEKIKSGG